MESREELENRLQFLRGEITRGWLIYAQYLDSNRTKEPEAIEVLDILRQLENERANVKLMLEPDEAKKFIATHRGSNAGNEQQVLPLP